VAISTHFKLSPPPWPLKPSRPPASPNIKCSVPRTARYFSSSPSHLSNSSVSLLPTTKCVPALKTFRVRGTPAFFFVQRGLSSSGRGIAVLFADQHEEGAIFCALGAGVGSGVPMPISMGTAADESCRQSSNDLRPEHERRVAPAYGPSGSAISWRCRRTVDGMIESLVHQNRDFLDRPHSNFLRKTINARCA